MSKLSLAYWQAALMRVVNASSVSSHSLLGVDDDEADEDAGDGTQDDTDDEYV